LPIAQSAREFQCERQQRSSASISRKKSARRQRTAFLTFDGFLGNCSNTVAVCAAGNFTIGVGGAGGLGSINLANNLGGDA